MSNGLCLCGIDPGLSGAVAWYFPAQPNLISVSDMPRMGDVLDAGQLTGWLEQMRPDFVFMEKPGSMPSDGHTQAFRFGRCSGAIEGVLAALRLPHALVRPSTWKKDLHLSADKDKSREMAIRLWPDALDESDAQAGKKPRGLFARTLDHNRAEAALIALWGSQQRFGQAREAAA